jgi:hypothetical protein
VSSPTCRKEEVSTNSTTFKWPETNGGSLAFFTCPNNMMFRVNRTCKIGGHWGTFDEDGCGTLAPLLSVLVVQNVISSIPITVYILRYNFCLFSIIQLTNETLVETVEELSTLVQQTEEKPVEQSTENLESIANVLVNVASFVNESDIEINDTVRDQFLAAG